MDSQTLSLFYTILSFCMLVGGFVVFSFMTRIRWNNRYTLKLHLQGLQMYTLQEQERKRMARDLHDHLAPLLSNIYMLIQKGIRDGDAESLQEAAVNSLRAIEDLDRVLHNLVPRNLEEDGLEDALTIFFYHLRRLYPQIRFRFDYQVAARLDVTYSRHLYFLVQELVHNAVRHSEATLIEAGFHQSGPMLLLACCDNGKGFTPGESCGLGQFSLEHRLVQLGGTMSRSTRQGKGTAYMFTIPLKESINDG